MVMYIGEQEVAPVIRVIETVIPTSAINYSVDNNGNAIYDPTQTTFTLPAGATKIGTGFLYSNAFRNNTSLTTVDLSSLETVSGQNACQYMFYGCSGLTSANLSSLETVSEQNACAYMFNGCTGLTSANLSSLTTVSGQNACGYMFYSCTGLTSADLSSLTTVSGQNACTYMFYSCSGLTSVDLSSLETISDGVNACSQMFYSCSRLTSIDLSSLTTISASSGCSYMFQGCIGLQTVTIGGTTAIDFGSYKNQFAVMFSGCSQVSGIDLYIATDETTLSQFTGYDSSGNNHHFGASCEVRIHYTAE